jgi:hypothetical protein
VLPPRRILVTLVAAVALVATALAGPAAAGAPLPPVPTVSGPVTGGRSTPALTTTTFDLGSVGYAESEYLVSGTATAYTAAKPLSSDGKWSVQPTSTAPYETRIVVVRPTDPRKFDGTVVVEWLNVTAGFDVAADWIDTHNALIRRGSAWVGVSAQQTGVSQIKTVDPARYAALHHPGDSFSYDIYSQVGRVLRRSGAVDPLGGLAAKRLIAAGDSQSAFRLVTYVNAIEPRDRVYDGFLVHSRSGSGAPLSQPPQPAVDPPNPTRIRDDVGVPVLTFETETDLEVLHYLGARQPDSKDFRLWEVAGTAHADSYTVGGASDTGTGSAEITLVDQPPTRGPLNCSTPINSGGQYAVLSAAIVRLDRWVRTGTAPAHAPRIRSTGNAIARDPHGNALGGIRTPLVDAPVAALSGSGQTGSSFCFLFGTTKPFDAATLTSLYPTHAAYVSAFRRSAARAVRAGYLLAPEAARLVAAAQESMVGEP